VLADPHPRPDRQSDGLRLWLLVAAGVLLVLALGVVHRITQKGVDTILIRVLEPEVQGLPPGEAVRIGSGLQRALQEALHEVDGVTVVDRPDPSEPAEEHLSASVYCGPQVCQVVLRRLNARDGRELWTDRVQVPVSEPADLVLQMRLRLQQAFPEPLDQ
jgi:hypothetical protein